MNDADKLLCVPEDIIFQSYWQRTLDHMRLVYDPEFSSTELFWGTPIISLAYSSIFPLMPEFFQTGKNILEYAESLYPKQGQIKNLGYLPFLTWFSFWRDRRIIFNFDFPENGETVTPETMENAGNRFPSVHGKTSLVDLMSYLDSSFYDFIKPVNLYGDAVETYGKYQMAKTFDAILDNHMSIIHTETPFVNVDVPDFYKRCDIYCTFAMKEITPEGTLIKENSSTVFGKSVNGRIGWIDINSFLYAVRMTFRVEIHSKSLLRYKYIIIGKTYSNRDGYGGGLYDFYKTPLNSASARYSVIYESPDWCTGDSVWEYEFKEGAEPSDNKPDYVWVSEPAVIIYPEYPDRLEELKRTQKKGTEI
ncbi:MAG: hypothetical protein E7040_00435 [Lentisphaerae bacterium]|nr:hypothetical protein [Lentisphaerota bacterium]